MVCNGRNHSPNCDCAFRGGFRARASWSGWSRSSVRSYARGPWATCPVCNAAVYYVPGVRGGGTYFDALGPPWPRHACTDSRRTYSPIGRTGKPKVRLLKSDLQKCGFLPFVVRRIENLLGGSIVHGVLLDAPTPRHLGTIEDLSLDRERPVFLLEGDLGLSTLNFFPANSDKPISLQVREDTLGPLDLLMPPLPRVGRARC